MCLNSCPTSVLRSLWRALFGAKNWPEIKAKRMLHVRSQAQNVVEVEIEIVSRWGLKAAAHFLPQFGIYMNTHPGLISDEQSSHLFNPQQPLHPVLRLSEHYTRSVIDTEIAQHGEPVHLSPKVV